MNPFVKLIAIFVGLLVIAICQQIFFNSSAAVAFATLGVIVALGYFLTRLVVCPKCGTPVVHGRMGMRSVERSKARLCLKCGYNLMTKAN
jgi:hypothetical protein